MISGGGGSARKWFSMIRGGGGGVSQKVIFDDQGVGGVSQKVIFDDQGGGESRPPPKKHDIINEQPLITVDLNFLVLTWIQNFIHRTMYLILNTKAKVDVIGVFLWVFFIKHLMPIFYKHFYNSTLEMSISKFYVFEYCELFPIGSWQ